MIIVIHKVISIAYSEGLLKSYVCATFSLALSNDFVRIKFYVEICNTVKTQFPVSIWTYLYQIQTLFREARVEVGLVEN